jgi:hypothetical protein
MASTSLERLQGGWCDEFAKSQLLGNSRKKGFRKKKEKCVFRDKALLKLYAPKL